MKRPLPAPRSRPQTKGARSWEPRAPNRRAEQTDERSAAFGKLVHALLALPRQPGDGLATSGRALAPRYGLGEADATAAAELASRARDLPAIAAAEKADLVYRELPFAVPIDGVLVNGQIDLVYRQAGEWTVIDFKTADLTDAQHAIKAHGAQMAVYRQALGRITGKEPRAALCLIKSGQLVEVEA